MHTITFPVRVLKLLGVNTLIGSVTLLGSDLKDL